jgi:hypothetical protein
VSQCRSAVGCHAFGHCSAHEVGGVPADARRFDDLASQKILRAAEKFSGHLCGWASIRPPGSGKTTTLIKRLAQKRTVDALTEKETAYDREHFLAPASWAMFSPTGTP